MRERIISVLGFVSRPLVALGSASIAGAVLIAFALQSTAVAPSGAYAPVTVGPIEEVVSVSAVVQAAHSTDLSFQSPGSISSIGVQVGSHVTAGETLATLNAASAAAALAAARASLEVQQAKLASLKAGTRPEQLVIDATAERLATQALSDAVQSAYVVADDAVHVKADQVFSNPRTQNATLSVQVPDATLVNRVQTERVAIEPILVSWGQELASSTASAAEANLVSVNVFLGNLATALAETPAGGSVSATTLAGYQASVNAGRLNVSNALTALTAANLAEKSAAGTLALAQSGPTTDDVAMQQAAVNAAAAAVQAAQVNANNTKLTAPVTGVITAQNANLGEVVAPGVPVMSLIAGGALEARAYISENDIGKVAVGELATASFSAYPGTVFPAVVTTVDPAATTVNDVSAYGVTVTFTGNDSRIKPGLPAYLEIVAATKKNALLVPSSAIISNGTQQFVYVKSGGTVIETPVTTGITGSKGVTEVTSGLTAGEKVLSFGASAAL